MRTAPQTCTSEDRETIASPSRAASRSHLLLVIRHFLVTLFLVTCHLSLVTSASAQDDDPAPPPLRMITKDEKVSLEAQSNVKARTQLALDYMNVHLAAAEGEFSKHDFDAMFKHLGGFHALVDNTLRFLTAGDKSNKKVLDNLKRFEIALRMFMPRLETIHHELPFRYEEYVRKLIAYVRNARTKALDPMFADTVVKPQ